LTLQSKVKSNQFCLAQSTHRRIGKRTDFIYYKAIQLTEVDSYV